MSHSHWPEIAGLRRQLDDLEWLLSSSKYDPKRWKARTTAIMEDGAVTLGVVLTKRSNRVVKVLAQAQPTDGERHFWIDGNHHYDRHATSRLADALGQGEKEGDNE